MRTLMPGLGIFLTRCHIEQLADQNDPQGMGGAGGSTQSWSAAQRDAGCISIRYLTNGSTSAAHEQM